MVQCIGEREIKQCRIGETLAFKLTEPTNQPYFASFAIHKVSKKVYWYYPTNEDGSSILIKDYIMRGVLTNGIRISSAHMTGEYRVYGIFSTAPLNRSEIREQLEGNGLKGTGDISLVELDLLIK